MAEEYIVVPDKYAKMGRVGSIHIQRQNMSPVPIIEAFNVRQESLHDLQKSLVEEEKKAERADLRIEKMIDMQM